MPSIVHAACPELGADQIFTALPYDPQKMQGIVPLGEMGPPDHTLPVHHLYYESLSDGQGAYQPTNIFSPGNMILVAVEDFKDPPNINLEQHDYVLHMYYRHDGTKCDEIRMYISHMASLEAGLLNQIGDMSNNPTIFTTTGSRHA